RRGGRDRGDDLAAVRALAHHLEAERGAQDAPQTGPDQLLVIDKQHPDHDVPPVSGSLPRPPGPASQLPPTDSARSRMLITPRPGPAPALPALPGTIRLSAVSVTSPAQTRSPTSVGAPGACLAAFVSASCAMRYTARPVVAGSPAMSPSTVSVTSAPAERNCSTR